MSKIQDFHPAYMCAECSEAEYVRTGPVRGMYGRHNCSPDGPGRWVSGDGMYEFYRGHRAGYATDWWYAVDRGYWTGGAHVSRVFGITRTLNAAFALAARYYMHPAVPVDRWEYPDA